MCVFLRNPRTFPDPGQKPLLFMNRDARIQDILVNCECENRVSMVSADGRERIPYRLKIGEVSEKIIPSLSGALFYLVLLK